MLYGKAMGCRNKRYAMRYIFLVGDARSVASFDTSVYFLTDG